METKPGMKSSEFLALIASIATAALNKKLGLEIDETTMLGILGAVSTYIAGRSWAKKPAAAAQ